MDDFRSKRSLSVRALSARLGEVDHKLVPSGITKIENGSRRVDAGDLVVLAITLGTTPNRLLFPATDPQAAVELTPRVAADQRLVWEWAAGRAPVAPPHLSATYEEVRRDALPTWIRDAEAHPAMRAATDLRNRLYEVVVGPPQTHPGDVASVRRALKRLVAELDDLEHGREVKPSA